MGEARVSTTSMASSSDDPSVVPDRSASIVRRTAAGQPLVAVKIRVAASVRAATGTTSAGRAPT